MSKQLLFLIILIEGFLTICIEILSIRQMVPFVGSNVLNTSIIIGIFLLSLSIGYYKGGTISDKYREVLLANLIKTFFFISFGLSYMFLYFLFSHIEGIYGLIVFSLLIMAPTVFYLGQTIPILTNLVKNERNGKISGELLFLSTFGSFLGSIITSVILLNFFGVNATVIVVISLLSLLILILSLSSKENEISPSYITPRFVKSLLIISILLPISILINLDYSFIKTNNYSNIKVVDHNQTKYLLINNSASSNYNPKTGLSDFTYFKTIKSYINSIESTESKSILVLGAGGFTISLNDNLNKYTFVDIDKDLKDISEEYFLGKKINGEFIVDDGRHFLIKNKKKFDIIIVDVYSNKTSIPSSFVTTDFYKDLSKTLSKDGVLIVNTIAKPLFKDPYSRKLNHSILQSFDCNVVPVETNLNTYQNIVYSCSSKVNDSELVYTDNLTNLFELIEK